MWSTIVIVLLTGWTSEVICDKFIDEPQLVELIKKNKQSINECKDYYEHICHGTKNIMYASERANFMTELKTQLLHKMRDNKPNKSDFGSDESEFEYELAKELVPEYLKKARTFYRACEDYYTRDQQGYEHLLQKLLQIRKLFPNGLVSYNINWQIAAFPDHAFLDIFTTIGETLPTKTAKAKYMLSIKPAKPSIPEMETSMGWNAREKKLEAFLEKVLLALIKYDCKHMQGLVFGLCDKNEKKQKDTQQKEIKRRIKSYIKLEKAQIKLQEDYEKEEYKKQKAIFKKHNNDLDKIADELDKDEMERVSKLSDLKTKLGKAYVDLEQLLEAHMPPDVWKKAFPDGKLPQNTEILVQRIELVIKQAELGFNSSKNDPRITADYLEMRVILAHAHAMGRQIVYEKATQAHALHGEASIVFKNCATQTIESFPHQLDRFIGENSLWVKPPQHVKKPEQYKARYNNKVQKLFDEVKDTFKEIVRERKWHSDSTKKAIEDKVTAIKLHMGYMKDYVKDETLATLYTDYDTLTATSFLQMAMDVDLMRAKREFRALLQDNVGYTPILKHSGTYYRSTNSVLISPVYLREAFVIEEEVLLLSGLVWVMAHEVGHSEDYSNSRMTKDGLLNDLWDAKDRLAYKNEAACMVDAYNKEKIISLFGGLLSRRVDGTQTLDENLADSAAMEITLKMLKKRMGTPGREKVFLQGINGYTEEKLYFASLTFNWCRAHETFEALVASINDSHSPAKHRINAMFKNSEFGRVFSCKEGTAKKDSPDDMNPFKKCSPWGTA